ncbi:MAG: hypothetical protein ACYCSW_10760 [bacterium]
MCHKASKNKAKKGVFHGETPAENKNQNKEKIKLERRVSVSAKPVKKGILTRCLTVRQ